MRNHQTQCGLAALLACLLTAPPLFAAEDAAGQNPAPAPEQANTLSWDAVREQVYTNSLGMEFVLIQPGTFKMGSAAGKGGKEEWPKHKVEITKPFYLAKTEVTQAQWAELMNTWPSQFEGDNLPVETVSWHDAQEFIKRLNAKEGHERYRLPTEAEWEYACRAGSETDYAFGNDVAQLDRYAWHKGNAQGATHPVGQKEPNAWGLYDMHGNVWEWTADIADWNYYGNSPVQDPEGPKQGDRRVDRGGSWKFDAPQLRSAQRWAPRPDERWHDIGFRLALSAE